MKSFQLTLLALARAKASKVLLPLASGASGMAAGRVSLGPDQPWTATPFYYFPPSYSDEAPLQPDLETLSAARKTLTGGLSLRFSSLSDTLGLF